MNEICLHVNLVIVKRCLYRFVFSLSTLSALCMYTFFYIFVRVTQTETSQQIYGQLTTLISPLESCNRYEAVSLSHTSLKSVLRFLWAFFFNCDLLFQMSRRVWIARINWPKYNQSKWLQLSWRWLHTNLKPTYAETCGWLQLCFVYAFLFSVCIIRCGEAA